MKQRQAFSKWASGLAVTLLLVSGTGCTTTEYNLNGERPFSDFLRQVLVPGLAPALIGALAWYGVKLAIPIGGWPELFLCGALGGAVYIAVLLGFCLDTRERQGLRKLLARLGLAAG